MIERFRPSGGFGVRIETHAHEGYRVSPRYDSLIAKLIVHQPTRPDAIRCMQRCLDEFTIKPIQTTIPFLRQVMAHPDFAEGPRAFAEKREPAWNPDPNARVEDDA